MSRLMKVSYCWTTQISTVPFVVGAHLEELNLTYLTLSPEEEEDKSSRGRNL